jgi:hypothetical protein
LDVVGREVVSPAARGDASAVILQLRWCPPVKADPETDGRSQSNNDGDSRSCILSIYIYMSWQDPEGLILTTR